MDIKIIAIGQIDQNYLTNGCELYLKRIKNYAKIEIFEFKEIINQNLKIAIDQQTKSILTKLKDYQNYYKILLAIKGKQLSSESFSILIGEIKDFKNAKILFIIGGSDGLNANLLKQMINFELSFGSITLPHQLCRLILLEQIYRSFKIIKQEKYHK